MEHVFRENFVMGALYSYTCSGVIDIPVATCVDDISASEPRAEHIMREVQKILIFGTQEQSEFLFCGVEMKQTSAHTICGSAIELSKQCRPVGGVASSPVQSLD